VRFHRAGPFYQAELPKEWYNKVAMKRIMTMMLLVMTILYFGV